MSKSRGGSLAEKSLGRETISLVAKESEEFSFSENVSRRGIYRVIKTWRASLGNVIENGMKRMRRRKGLPPRELGYARGGSELPKREGIAESIG